jgi:sRNA-binding carbon storage regulator CsrA
MLRKNIRPNENGPPVELSIGADIVIRFVKVGNRVVSVAIGAPKEMEIRFTNLTVDDGIER